MTNKKKYAQLSPGKELVRECVSTEEATTKRVILSPEFASSALVCVVQKLQEEQKKKTIIVYCYTIFSFQL